MVVSPEICKRAGNSALIETISANPAISKHVSTMPGLAPSALKNIRKIRNIVAPQPSGSLLSDKPYLGKLFLYVLAETSY